MANKLKENRSWFKWDYSSRNDNKIIRLIRLEGNEGYGIFVSTIELLHESDGMSDIDSIYYSVRGNDMEKLIRILNDYDLFYIQDNLYRNSRVDEQLEDRKIKSIKATRSVNSRWNKNK